MPDAIPYVWPKCYKTLQMYFVPHVLGGSDVVYRNCDENNAGAAALNLNAATRKTFHSRL